MTRNFTLAKPSNLGLTAGLFAILCLPSFADSGDEAEAQAVRLADRLAVVAADPRPESCAMLPSLLYQVEEISGSEGQSLSAETRLKINRNSARAKAECQN